MTASSCRVGCFLGTRAAARAFAGDGAIVNISSVSAHVALPNNAHYGATKGGIEALTRHAALDLAPRRIRVNCVAPGPVWTPLIPATFPPDKVEGFGESEVPMARAAQPDEIAPSYVFFAADSLSSYYTGEILAPIGGETLPG